MPVCRLITESSRHWFKPCSNSMPLPRQRCNRSAPELTVSRVAVQLFTNTVDCLKSGCMTVSNSLAGISWLLAMRGCLLHLRIPLLQVQSARAAEWKTENSLEGIHQQLQAAVEAQRLLAAQIETERGALGATQAERQVSRRTLCLRVYVHCKSRIENLLAQTYPPYARQGSQSAGGRPPSGRQGAGPYCPTHPAELTGGRHEGTSWVEPCSM